MRQCPAIEEPPGVFLFVFRGVEKAHDGKCGDRPAVCICQPVYRPVCGVDGHTYSNLCEMDCRSLLTLSVFLCVSACAHACVVMYT